MKNKSRYQLQYEVRTFDQLERITSSTNEIKTASMQNNSKKMISPLNSISTIEEANKQTDIFDQQKNLPSIETKDSECAQIIQGIMEQAYIRQEDPQMENEVEDISNQKIYSKPVSVAGSLEKQNQILTL